MSESGLRAVVELSRKGIKTNVTAIMAVNQAILAAQAGATYASIFLARIGDMGYDPIQVIREAVELYEKNRVTTRIIVGSIRHLMHINQAASAGAHIITIPYKFFHQMAHNPQTEATIQEFLQSWNQARLPI
jgi:transaldolase